MGRILYAGFGAIIVLMLAAGADTLRVLHRVRVEEREAGERTAARTRELDRIRSGIFQTAILSRDLLLAPDPALRSRLASSRAEIAGALTAYARLAGESDTFRSLRGEIHAYGQMLDLLLEMDARSPFLHRDLIARRDSMLNLTSQIAGMNRADAAARDAALSSALDGFRTRVLLILGISALTGAGLAVFTIRRTLQLQAGLRELSARLVQAQEEERRRISRELHDQVAQSLSSMLVELDNIAADPRRPLTNLREQTQRSIEEVRNMALLLRPSMLDDLGLVPALEWQAREAHKRSGLRVDVQADESASEIPDEQATCIFRVAQEALNNTSRWAQAAHAQVILTRQNGSVQLLIRDDGRGFQPSRATGMGIAGMRERVKNLGGVFRIDSEPGKGSLVSVELPL